nr:hypothetical protein Q903MT_gene2044 [Picea sitchensis]
MHDLCGLMNWCVSRCKKTRYACFFVDAISLSMGIISLRAALSILSIRCESMHPD